MKKCTSCCESLSLDSFYKHPETKDKLHNKCKSCIKVYNAHRYKTLSMIPGWKEEQSRKTSAWAKAKRSGTYKSSRRTNNRKETRRRATRTFAVRWPEKAQAYKALSSLPRKKGYERHHWSYNDEHHKDVILVRKDHHYLIARFMTYDREFKMYRRKDNNELLDTREKHESLICAIISIVNTGNL